MHMNRHVLQVRALYIKTMLYPHFGYKKPPSVMVSGVQNS